MKKILLALALFTSMHIYALPRNYRLNTAVSNLGLTYSARIFSELVHPTVLLIDNNTNREIELNCSHTGATAPLLSELTSFWVRSSVAVGVDKPIIMGDCWVRAVDGPATSGVLTITIQAEN